mgnify:CR=1 FL=1
MVDAAEPFGSALEKVVGADSTLSRETDGALDLQPLQAAIVERAQEQYDLGPLDWHEVDASGTPDKTLTRARKALGL